MFHKREIKVVDKVRCQRRINRRINLARKRERGHDSENYKLYHPEAAGAARAFNRNPDRDVYFLDDLLVVPDDKRPPRMKGARVWRMLDALD